MNRDLMLSILAMDSYNRGYGKGVVVAGSSVGIDTAEVGRRLGNATIIQQDTSEAALAAGFYAIAYNWNGETVISYRGTNFGLDLNGDRQVVRELFDSQAYFDIDKDRVRAANDNALGLRRVTRVTAKYYNQSRLSV